MRYVMESCYDNEHRLGFPRPLLGEIYWSVNRFHSCGNCLQIFPAVYLRIQIARSKLDWLVSTGIQKCSCNWRQASPKLNYVLIPSRLGIVQYILCYLFIVGSKLPIAVSEHLEKSFAYKPRNSRMIVELKEVEIQNAWIEKEM